MITVCNVLIGHPVQTFDNYHYYYYLLKINLLRSIIANFKIFPVRYFIIIQTQIENNHQSLIRRSINFSLIKLLINY